MTKVYCSELAVQVVYDAMRVVGVESCTLRTPLERLMRDALVYPLYDGGNMGVRRRQPQLVAAAGLPLDAYGRRHRASLD